MGMLAVAVFAGRVTDGPALTITSIEPHKLGCKHREEIEFSIGVAELNNYVFPLGIAKFS